MKKFGFRWEWKKLGELRSVLTSFSTAKKKTKNDFKANDFTAKICIMKTYEAEKELLKRDKNIFF